MKTILFLLLVVPFTVFGQQQNNQVQSEKIIVDAKDLPPDFVNQLKQKQQIETYGEWAGKGKEVGIAIRDGLMAVKDVSVEFSNTKLGTFTMVLVAWKVIGKDIVRILIGIAIFIVSTIMIFYSYIKTCIPRRIKVEDPGFFKYPKKYQTVNAMFDQGGGAALHTLAFIVMTGFSALVMFA